MISEKRVNQGLDLIHPDLLLYLSTFLPQSTNENCSDFALPLDTVEFLQATDLHSQVMYEGEKVASSQCTEPSKETVKAQLTESDCILSTSQEVPILSRQSSLIEEWFGNISNAHPNDISVDSSLEALFANTEWQDFEVEMRTTDDTAVTENCLADPSVYKSVNYQSPDSIPPVEPVACESLPLFSEVCKTELQQAVPENIGEYSSQCIGVARPAGVTRTMRKRHISSESQESFTSDVDSQCSASGESIEDLARFARKFLSDGSRSKPYFWQYNAQSRGPKAQRLCSSVTVEDSHVVPDFADPVFRVDAPYQLSHSGKARQGDGNDSRPDPQKLLAIGSCIWRLETEFKSVSVESAGASSSRSSMNQRKNQLASKICRLKKKALHSANKIKLDGLKQEHDQLMKVITSITDEIDQCTATNQIGHYSLCQALDQLISKHLTFMIAGNTAEYVNSELEKVATKLVSGKE